MSQLNKFKSRGEYSTVDTCTKDSSTKLTSKKTTVSILSFDIFLQKAMVHTNKNDHKNLRLKLFMKELKKYDIVNFQELHKDTLTGRRKRLIQKAKAKGLTHVAKPKGQPLLSKRFRGSGLLTLSRFKMVTKGFQAFKASYGKDSFSHKGLSYSQIELPNEGVLHLFNTHLQQAPHPIYRKDERKHYIARLKQILETKKIINHYLNGSSKTLKDQGKDSKSIILLTGNFGLNARRSYIPVSDMVTANFKDEDSMNWLQRNIVEHPLEPEGVFSEYEFLKFVLEGSNKKDTIVDLGFQSQGGKHPVTYGDSFNRNRGTIPREAVLTSKVDFASEKCVDFAFQIIPEGQKSNNFKPECQLMPFFVDMNENNEIRNKISQLSSHYGLKITIQT